MITLEDALAECPIVAIIRGVRPDEAVAHAEALFEAGVRAVEVPLNSPEPFESIKAIVQAYRDRMVIGAGTVLDKAGVEKVAAAGGKLVVSPNTNPAVIAHTSLFGMEAAPGFATPTEAFAAFEAGARHLKLFPAVTYGPRHVNQIRAVLPPEATVWAVGGIGGADFEDWWRVGVRAFGLGSELYKPGQSAGVTREKADAVVKAAQALRP